MLGFEEVVDKCVILSGDLPTLVLKHSRQTHFEICSWEFLKMTIYGRERRNQRKSVEIEAVL